MKQVYTNTTENIYLRVYKDGVLFDADAPPAFSISVVGSTNPARTGTAVHESTGIYYVLTDISETEAEGRLRIEWSYDIAAVPGTRVDYVTVVTPYASFLEVKDLAPEGTSDADIEDAETFSRFIINAHCGQTFGQRYDTIKMHGNDQAVLVLPNRIVRLDQIDVNGEVVYTRDPEVNDFGKIVTISDTNYGLLATKTDNVPSYSSDFIGWPAWKKQNWYSLSGLYGWEQVPDEVQFAARLLADDYFCKETAWKKRYVEQINASDWRVVFNQRQFQHTGNFYVDAILENYRSIGMAII